MGMMEDIRDTLDSAKTTDGDWFGRSFQVWRPDYSDIEDGEYLVYTRNFRYEQLGPKLTEPNLPEVEYYALFGNLKGVLPGDVLIDPLAVAPTMVVVTNQSTKETHCVRVDRTCTIADDVNTTILTTARYSWLKRSESFGQHGQDMRQVTSYSGRKVVLYAYNEIKPQNVVMHGKRLLETDGALSPPLRWMIMLAEYMHPLVILTLEEEV